jgi:hypothetical protein
VADLSLVEARVNGRTKRDRGGERTDCMGSELFVVRQRYDLLVGGVERRIAHCEVEPITSTPPSQLSSNLSR